MCYCLWWQFFPVSLSLSFSFTPVTAFFFGFFLYSPTTFCCSFRNYSHAQTNFICVVFYHFFFFAILKCKSDIFIMLCFSRFFFTLYPAKPHGKCRRIFMIKMCKKFDCNLMWNALLAAERIVQLFENGIWKFCSFSGI